MTDVLLCTCMHEVHMYEWLCCYVGWQYICVCMCVCVWERVCTCELAIYLYVFVCVERSVLCELAICMCMCVCGGNVCACGLCTSFKRMTFLACRPYAV